MTTDIILSVTIPTYNRPLALAKTLKSLLPQLVEGVEVVVLDNCSEVPAYTVYMNIESGHSQRPSQIRFVRNASNLGMQANILRCFEYAQGTWTWVLSDDDQPKPDAVATILRLFRSADESMIAVNFASEIGPRSSNFQKRGLNSILDGIDHFGNFLLISSNIYRTSAMKESLRIGYIYSYSHAVLLAMLFNAVREDQLVVFRCEALVSFNQLSTNEEKWSSISLMLGISILLELPIEFSKSGFASLEKHILTMALPPKELFAAACRDVNQPKNVRWRVFSQSFLRCYSSGTIIKFPYLKLAIFRMLFEFPKLAHFFTSTNMLPHVNSDISQKRLDRL